MKQKGGLHVHRGLIALSVFFLTAVALSACSKARKDVSLIRYGTQPNRPAIALRTGESNAAGKSSVDPSAMISAHNQWRSRAGVSGIRWSKKLVDVAKTWADSLKNDDCGFYHSGNGYGENLYKASPLMWSDGRREFQNKTPREVTDSWGSEIKYYNYEDNSCVGVCGHYTQVVWKNTTEVGCAMSVCDDKSQVWVCSYFPAGNFVGQKPY